MHRHGANACAASEDAGPYSEWQPAGNRAVIGFVDAKSRVPQRAQNARLTLSSLLRNTAPRPLGDQGSRDR